MRDPHVSERSPSTYIAFLWWVDLLRSVTGGWAQVVAASSPLQQPLPNSTREILAMGPLGSAGVVRPRLQIPGAPQPLSLSYAAPRPPPSSQREKRERRRRERENTGSRVQAWDLQRGALARAARLHQPSLVRIGDQRRRPPHPGRLAKLANPASRAVAAFAA